MRIHRISKAISDVKVTSYDENIRNVNPVSLRYLRVDYEESK